MGRLTRGIVIVVSALAAQGSLAERPGVAVQIGHAAPVSSAALSADGRLLATGSIDLTVKLWEVRTGRQIRSFQGEHPVRCVSFSPDGRLVACGNVNDTVKVWHVRSGKEVRAMRGDSYREHPWGVGVRSSPRKIQSVQFSPDSKLLATEPFKLWDVEAGEPTRVHTLRPVWGESVSFSPDGRLLAVAAKGGIEFWDVEAGRRLRALGARSKSAWLLVFSPDGRMLASAHPGGTVKLWDLGAAELVGVLSRYEDDGAPYVSYNPGLGRTLAVGGRGDLVTKADAAVLVGLWSRYDGDGTPYMSFSPDGRTLAVGGRGGVRMKVRDTIRDREVLAYGVRVKLWDTRANKEVRRYEVPGVTGHSVIFGRQGELLLLCCDGEDRRVLRLWDLDAQRENRLFQGHTDLVTSVSFSPDGRSLACGRMRVGGGRVALWDLGTNKRIGVPQCCCFRFPMDYRMWGTLMPWGRCLVSFSPNGRFLAASIFGGQAKGGVAGQVRIWELAQTSRFAFPGPGQLLVAGVTNSLSFGPTGDLLAINDGSSVALWDVPAGRKARTLEVGAYSSLGLHASSLDLTGELLAVSGQYGRKIELWNMRTGGHCRTLGGREGTVERIAFSSRGRLLASAGTDKAVRLWDVRGGRESLTLRGHFGIISSLAFSPDDKLLVTGSLEGQVRVWDVATGEEVRSLRGHTSKAASVAFRRDGKVLATGSWDGTTKLWHMPSGKMLAALVAVGLEDYVVTTPDNYYLASRGALKAVAFVLGDRAFPVEQFDLKFNRPDIVLSRLGYAREELVEACHQAYQRRLRKMKFTEEMLGDDIHLPEVAVIPKGIPAAMSRRDLEIPICARDTKYLVDRIKVFVNDVPAFGRDGYDLRLYRVQAFKTQVPVELSKGTNKIQISVLNQRGAESLRETLYVECTDRGRPSLWIVAIGVSRYTGSAYNLAFAAKDANDIASIPALPSLKPSFDRRFGKIIILKLADSEATRENILEAKGFLEKSGVDDTAIVFAAGHGILDDEYDYYFGTHDIDFRNPSKRGLPFDELSGLLDGIPARQKLLLLDTCHAGEIDAERKPSKPVLLADARGREQGGGARGREARGEERTAKGGPTVTVRSFLGGRGVNVVEEKITPQALGFLLQENLFADLRRGTGAVVIAACSGDEYSVEGEKWGNGVFTYSVLECLKHFEGDTNKDNKIQVSELRNYVINRVRELTHGGQNPTVRQENLANDFVVVARGETE